MLMASEQKVEEGRLGIERVSQQQVEGAWIGGDHPRQQA